MNIAYLIAAHTDPEQLRKLVLALDNGKNDFFIHIDKKSNQSVFEMALKGIDRVYFIKRRIKDFWGGFSHMLALETLLEEAVREKHDRLVYISGLDYPVWSNEKMEKFYQENPRKQLVCGYNITQSKNELARTKINHYARWDVNIKNEKLSNKVRQKLNEFLAFIPHATSFKVDGVDWDVYWGSDWWSMTYDCAKYVYDTYHKHPEIRKFFKFTFCPSELWVQTILANSKYKKEMEITEEYNFNIVTVLQLIDYTSAMYVWREKDYEKVITSDKMFIRKVVTKISDELCKKIDISRNCE